MKREKMEGSRKFEIAPTIDVCIGAPKPRDSTDDARRDLQDTWKSAMSGAMDVQQQASAASERKNPDQMSWRPTAARRKPAVAKDHAPLGSTYKTTRSIDGHFGLAGPSHRPTGPRWQVAPEKGGGGLWAAVSWLGTPDQSVV